MNFDYDEMTPGSKPEDMKSFLFCLSAQNDPYMDDRIRTNRMFNEIRRPCCEDICRRILKKISSDRKQ